MMDAHKVLRVLSIDGGGMRGLYTVAYLSSLVPDFDTCRYIIR